MKRSLLLLLAGTFLILGGCVSTGGSRVANSQYGANVDVDKVVTVNQWAQTKGARVMWINYPQKPKDLDSAGPIN